MPFNTILSTLNAAYNLTSGYRQNRYNREAEERAYQRQRQLIREANVYNSPANQKRLYAEAGFNPALAVTGGNFVAQQVGQGPAPFASADLGSGDAVLQLKQGKLLDAQIANIEADVRQKNIRIANEEFDLAFKKKVEQYNLEKEQNSVRIQDQEIRKLIQEIKVGEATEEQLKASTNSIRINNLTLNEKNLAEIAKTNSEASLNARKEANIAFMENVEMLKIMQRDTELKIMKQNADANTMNAHTNRMNAETAREKSNAEINLINAQTFGQNVKNDMLAYQRDLDAAAHKVKMAHIEEKTKQDMLYQIQQTKTAIKQAEIAQDMAWTHEILDVGGKILDMATDVVSIATGTSGLVKGAKEMKGMVMPSKTEKKPLKTREVRTGKVKGKDGKWYDNETETRYYYE